MLLDQIIKSLIDILKAFISKVQLCFFLAKEVDELHKITLFSLNSRSVLTNSSTELFNHVLDIVIQLIEFDDL